MRGPVKIFYEAVICLSMFVIVYLWVGFIIIGLLPYINKG